MNSKALTTIGLCLGMLGVILIFIWGPPQPNLKPGVSIELEDNNPVNETGQTVAEYNQEVIAKKATHACMSRIGLIMVFIGFTCQLISIWIPGNKNKL
ncbi:MAG TPA: hypothetical protein ENH85_13540 [Candidatus Scalindua sp.]|nr:hypothetical protein [Candidatus Scalindua sp.]